MIVDSRQQRTRRNGPMCRVSDTTHALLNTLRERTGLPSTDALIFALATEALQRADVALADAA